MTVGDADDESAWKKRKRIVSCALETITESMDKHTPKSLANEMAIETDEDWNLEIGQVGYNRLTFM